MEIVSIATVAITAVIPFLKKSFEKVSEELGKSLWELIKKPFKSKEEQASVDKLKANPEDQTARSEVISKLSQSLEKDPELLNQLNALLRDPQILNYTQNVSGDSNVALQGIFNSQVNISK
jgi:Tfp pilus assembly protein PilN